MMKHEFESIVNRTVTDEQYKAIEALYLDSNLDKFAFAKSIKGMLKSIPEQHKRTELVMACHNKLGDMLTPNHAYYLTVLVELVDVNIKTGKRTVKVIPNSFELRSGYDISDWDAYLEIIR